MTARRFFEVSLFWISSCGCSRSNCCVGFFLFRFLMFTSSRHHVLVKDQVNILRVRVVPCLGLVLKTLGLIRVFFLQYWKKYLVSIGRLIHVQAFKGYLFLFSVPSSSLRSFPWGTLIFKDKKSYTAGHIMSCKSISEYFGTLLCNHIFILNWQGNSDVIAKHLHLSKPRKSSISGVIVVFLSLFYVVDRIS